MLQIVNFSKRGHIEAPSSNWQKNWILFCFEMYRRNEEKQKCFVVYDLKQASHWIIGKFCPANGASFDLYDD